MQLPQTPSFRLDGNRASVTGASRGIGLGAACALAQAGAEPVLAARVGDESAALCDALGAAGYRAASFILDVGDTAAIRKAIGATALLDDFGQC